MATKVFAPRPGEGVTELTVVRWLKNEGDAVKEFEPLVEVETDKVVTEIPSPANGTLLKKLAEENKPVNVGAVIAWIGQPGESIEGGAAPVPVEEKKVEKEAQPSAESQPTHASDGNGSGKSHAGGFISPVVAKIASEQHVDLGQVKGTGLGGRITKKDVLDYLSAPAQAAPRSEPQPMNQPTMHMETSAAPMQGDQVIPQNVIRKSIAERMVSSKQTSAHVLTVMEADLSRVIAHRNANKESFSRRGINLTFTSYFISAIVAGLHAYPVVNSSWSETGLVIHGAYNIGMATSLGEEGLIVPVIKNADRLSLSGLAMAVNDLSARARAKKLQPEEVRGGTFTITNHGISGSLIAMPIINQPQCGILGTGAIQKRVVVVTDGSGNDSIAIRPMVFLSFVFDHRILDGAQADWFLKKVVDTLENWS